jgi:ATP phosphoribosyltransferase regulatory subunit HisZ
MNALKQRAQAVLNDESLDDQSRATLRHALEQNDPWLADLVRRSEANEDDSRETIEALAEIICGAGNESAAALFVLMGTMQNSSEPEALANTLKHFAFTRCGEFNVFGMVDAQIAIVEGKLLAS